MSGTTKYTFPAMIAHADAMDVHVQSEHATLEQIGQTQSQLMHAQEGTTGEQIQAWLTQWRGSADEFVGAHRQLASTHRQNTMTMQARDTAEGAKWS